MEEKTTADIIDVISQYVNLRQFKKNKFRNEFYLGLCPFHKESIPSFIAVKTVQRFHCFGCGADGDVNDFINKISSLKN